MPIGIHGTPKTRIKSIQKNGLTKVPFYKSRKPVRSPLKFKLHYTPNINVISGKTKAQVVDAVYASLNSANIHVTGSARKRLRLDRIRLFFVDIEKMDIEKTGKRQAVLRQGISKKNAPKGEELEYVKGTVPSQGLKLISLTVNEITAIENKTKDMGWFDANRAISEFVAEKIMRELK